MLSKDTLDAYREILKNSDARVQDVYDLGNDMVRTTWIDKGTGDDVPYRAVENMVRSRR